MARGKGTIRSPSGVTGYVHGIMGRKRSELNNRRRTQIVPSSSSGYRYSTTLVPAARSYRKGYASGVRRRGSHPFKLNGK